MLAAGLCGSAVQLGLAAGRPRSTRAAIVEEEVADRVFQSAAASVVSVADFRRDSTGEEVSEVCLRPSLRRVARHRRGLPGGQLSQPCDNGCAGLMPFRLWTPNPKPGATELPLTGTTAPAVGVDGGLLL